VPFNEGELGIIIATASFYELPSALYISIPKALDGSEGLAEALAIIDSSRHLHLKHPLSIGMIGLVSPDGRLKPVFGIEQRVAAMRAGHLRYVIVPLVQQQIAKRASHGTIAVIGVTYLSQAVQEVERLARAKTPKEVVR
jgi:predicted S18 family serine protease